MRKHSSSSFALARGRTVIFFLLGVICVARGSSPLEEEVETAVRKELSSWRNDGDSELDLGDGSPGALAGASTTAQQLARTLGEDARADSLHRVGQGLGDDGKVIQGSLDVKGTITAQRVVVKDAFSAPAILASSITTAVGDDGAPSLVYLFSALHCHWEGSRLTGCPSSEVAWNGAANMLPASAAISVLGPTDDSDGSDQLEINFATPYATRPLCTVQFQDQVMYARVHTTEKRVQISLEAACGCPKKWSEIQIWITVICHGTATLDESPVAVR